MMRPLVARRWARNACVTLNNPSTLTLMMARDGVPIRDHGLRLGGEGIAAIDAGVVDEHRDLAEAGADVAGGGLAGLAIRHVEHKACGLATAFAHHGCGRGLRIAIEDEDARAVRAVAEVYRPADARAAAGDGGEPSLQKPRATSTAHAPINGQIGTLGKRPAGGRCRRPIAGALDRAGRCDNCAARKRPPLASLSRGAGGGCAGPC